MILKNHERLHPLAAQQMRDRTDKIWQRFFALSGMPRATAASRPAEPRPEKQYAKPTAANWRAAGKAVADWLGADLLTQKLAAPCAERLANNQRCDCLTDDLDEIDTDFVFQAEALLRQNWNRVKRVAMAYANAATLSPADVSMFCEGNA